MSSLARYFKTTGKAVAGYDLTPSDLTRELEAQGMQIHYDDNVELIDAEYKDIESTLVVFTPAIPNDHKELAFFKTGGFEIMKRAQVLGQLFNTKQGIAVAGTHGKTSVTTFVSYLLTETGIECSAFLGGIAKNFNSNLVIGKSDYVVAEADEFDRSFLRLFPKLLLVTTVDVDHLDIYKDIEDIKETFNELITQVDAGGTVILNHSINLHIPDCLNSYTYSYDNANSDFYASDIEISDGAYVFTFNTPETSIKGMRVEVPGRTNVENAIAALAISKVLGASDKSLQLALPKLKGAVRRFDVQYKSNTQIYIDDYAHHPRELDAVIGSIRELYPNKKLTVVFQPHLFSRTKDFAKDFAESLSKVDELLLLEIYPAREKPLPGVTSELIFEGVDIQNKQHCSKENLLRKIKGLNIEVLLTVGAGDIEQHVCEIKEYLEQNEEA